MVLFTKLRPFLNISMKGSLYLIPLLAAFIITACSKDSDPVLTDTQEVAVLKIETENKVAITSKTLFTEASITIEGQGRTVNEKIKIRGRGNSTWGMPKKPYKIEFGSKYGLLGLAPSKEWVLLANYLDGSLMLNAVSFKIGELLQMPFSNHAVPVDLWLNDSYEGNYMLTEQIEVKENRVDIGDDGLLISLDQVIDDDDQYFYSAIFGLPVIVKDPKNLTTAQMTTIEAEFTALENAIADPDFPNNGYGQLLDIDAMADYLLAQLLTGNEEINHPKSTYMFKSRNGKYTMGPLWDFDWAYSFEEGQGHFSNPDRPLFWEGDATGNRFFKKIYSDPAVRSAMAQKWQQFKAGPYATLLQYIEDYAANIRESRAADHALWQTGNPNFDLERENLKNWFARRSLYLDRTLL